MQKIYKPDNADIPTTFSPVALAIIAASGFQTFHASIEGQIVLVGFVAVPAPEACPK